ncbi:hypothetical protein KAH81_00910 [bacterium]|nr:hypothetical protein [bacterium]
MEKYISLFFIIFLLSTALHADPTIDEIWFSQDTICDDQTIVEICYILSGETAHVSAIMSADSGYTWSVPLDSLINDDGDLGFEITPGTHCFEWVMSHDLPDTDGTNWIVQIEVVNFLDTFQVIDSIDISTRPHYGWGLGYMLGSYWIYDYTSGYLYYSDYIDPVASPPRDSIFLGDSLNCDIDAEDYKIYFARSGSNPTQIYSIELFTGIETHIATVPEHGSSIQDVQVIGDSLYAAYYDSRIWSNRIFILAFDLTSTLPITSGWDTLTWAHIDTCTGMEGLAYGHGYLWGSNNYGRIIRADLASRTFTGCYQVPNIGLGAEGLCFDGSYLWYHNRELNRIWQIVITDTTSSRAHDIGPLDSRGPELTLDGPDSLAVGEPFVLTWSAEDLFGLDAPFEIIQTCSDIVETTFVSDTIFSGITPPYCDSLYFQVAARDSFCNYGYSSLSIPITSSYEPRHIFIQGNEGIYCLKVIDSSDASSAGDGVIMVQLPGFLGAANLVDTTDAYASPVFVNTPYGIRSWRYDSIIMD